MKDLSFSELCARYKAALGEIRREESKHGRSGVRLIAAAKYATSEELDALAEYCGMDVIGENRTDTLLEHYSGMKHKVEIHFIGHLQRNKVKQIIDKVSLIHSLDSEGLAEEIEKQAARLGITVNVLCEINIGREESKSGVIPEQAREFCAGLGKYPHIRLCGFMTMAPICENEAEYYKYFKETYDLALDIWKETLHNIGAPELSMGMSASFRPAIASGATMVRLGSNVFGRTTADMQTHRKI
ncbi:MAG: YggS family pyridoxal phosphate-dependent enzyme [Eubacteriales bacterium]